METTDHAAATGAVLPASFAQRRMWFLERFESGALYNVPLSRRLHGPLDVNALERAFEALIARHESLRTVFTLVDGVPHQVIRPARPFSLEIVDVTDEAAPDERALRIASEQAVASFDLARDEPLRVTLVRLDEQEHLLALTLHHIVADAWSTGVFNRELAALYAGFRAGNPVDLPELPIQYADYAVWQQQWLESGGLDRQLDFWRAQLDGAPPMLELPTDRPRPARQSFRGATRRVVLRQQLLEQVRGLGEAEGATLYMTLLAAFSALLARYSGQEDVVIASPVANRNRTELESVIGLFVNTLAMRVDLGGDPSFRELLARVRETVLGAFANQDLPFEKLVEELKPERHLSHAPVAQVMFVVQNAVESRATLEGIEQERVLTDRGTAKFDLTLFAADTADGLRLALEYCTDLFDETTADRMLEQFRVILEAAVADPERPVSRLRLLGEREEKLVLGAWNRTAKTFPADRVRPVHELVAERSQLTPHAPAVVLGAEVLSYRDLEGRANQLARHLEALGVRPASVVAICADRSPETMVAVLATLKAGGAYAPIDPTYPADRVAYMLEDTATPVLLTQARLVEGLPERGARTVRLDADWAEIALQDDRPFEGEATLDDLAYVIYTSGSTGRPKGVAMEHRPLANLLAWQSEQWAGRPPARTLQFASLSFDVAFQELFSTWSSGGALVLVEEEARRDPRALLGLLAEQRVERLFLPFVALQNLSEAARRLDVSLPALREVITAGEQLKVTDSVRHFFARHPACGLVNQYGPTESHVVTAHALAGPPDDWPALPPIGRPIANARVYLLDRHRQPVPVGVPGELYIGGTSLAREYLGRPDLTAERFLADPFSPEHEARLYRTGDLARYRPDGEIEYLGRADHQVKIRGFRVEPGEIEASLRRHPDIQEALVVARNDTGDTRLVSYLIAADPAPDPVELRELLARSLPEYMIPSAFVRLDAFPLSPNGKVDRSALPPPDDAARAVDAYAAPRTDLELRLVAIWQALLALERLGIDDNFFALGGHSLLATQLVSRVRDELGIEVPLRLVFEHPTVAQLAFAVEELRAELTEVDSAPEIRPASRRWRRLALASGEEDVVVLSASFAEQRLWFLHGLDSETGAYNLAIARRLRGPLDGAALERSVSELVARHETLRTTYSMIDDIPRRVIHRPRPVPLPITDLSGRIDAHDRAQALVEEEAGRGFDLETGPLLRARLLRLAEHEHVFILALHHIVMDGWSIGVVNRELTQLYSAYSRGRSPSLPEIALQYADYAEWQQRRLESGALDRQLDFWKQTLEGIPALLELPTDRPRPAEQTFRGDVVRSVLPPATVDRLKDFGEQERATLFMTLLAAFAALLSRYSGKTDIVVASPIANRERSELEALIGFFVNTLPLRVDLESEPSFRQLLARVRETAIGAFSNDELPFEKLVEELNPERHLSYSPIAQVMFSLQTAVGESSLELEGVTSEPVGGARHSTKFDLSLFALETPAGLRISLEYATDLFDADTVARMLEHYRVLLDAALTDPDQPIWALTLLTDAESKTILDEWNATETAYPQRSVHELIAERAARTPTAIAVQHEDEQLTYAELDTRANQLAHHLIALGVGPDVLVGICLERSLEMAVAVLGTLKAGGAYAPIDPRYPAERQTYMLADSQAPVVLTQDHLRAELPAGQATVVALDSDWPSISRLRGTPPQVATTLAHLSYVIYTSGSTGEPKGVQLPHGALVNLLATMGEMPGFRAQDVLLSVTTLSFDIATLELLMPLLHGGRVVIAPTEATTDPQALIELLERSGATVLQATPTTWKMLVEAGWTGRPGLKAITGGEPLTTSLADQLLARGLELWNCYGPSETTIYSTREHVTESSPITIGRPLANTRLYVLDARMQPIPVGVPGELWIGGVGLARSYRGRPELTSERFVPDPFSASEGSRLYRTGDLVRYLRDGRLEYLGRADHQVKIRGFRIELGEIETTIRRHGSVREAVVVARADETGDTRLVAYVAADSPEPPADELRTLLQRALPDYMIPSAFVMLKALPLTPNGKIDRKALPEPGALALARAEFAPPQSELERSLADLWQQVLKVDRVGRDDDFFALGGHSLLATKLISRVRETIQPNLPLRTIFAAPTLAAFAAAVEHARPGEVAGGKPPPLEPCPREWQQAAAGGDEEVVVLPASYAEQRLWFLDRFEPDSTAYNVPLTLRLRGALDVSALDRALSELVARHESLRTTFTLVDGVPHRVIHRARPTSLPVEDLAGMKDAEARAQELVHSESRRPFDLEAGPLLRAGLLRLSASEHIFLLTLHHIVVDAWSIGVLNRELSELYAGFVSGRPATLPEPRLQYADYAAWQQRWIDGGGLDDELAYWKRQLAGAPPLLELPTDLPRPRKQSFRGATVRARVPADVLGEAKALGEQEGTTLFMTLLGVFACLLARYSGQEDIVIASPVANRDHVELEGVIGFFVNTLALRVDLEGQPSFRELLARVRETALEAFANQHLQFEKLVEELNPERHLSHAPIAQVLFVQMKAGGEGSLELPGVEPAPVPHGRETTKVDMTLFAVEKADGLQLSIEYCADLFEEATVLRMLDQYRVLLEEALRNPDAPIAELPMIGADERQALVARFAGEPVEFPVWCLHERFEQEAETHPAAPAVVLGGSVLSYGELNERANRLAHLLRSLGVQNESLVALCLERSLDLVVAIVAVLKAGGAYVPLDPEYPADRLAFALEDTGAPVLLTQEHLLERLPPHEARVICLDRDAALLAASPTTNPEQLSTPSSAAYVIYTSGSTGRPKGVSVEHRNVARLFTATEGWFGFGPDDTWLLLHSYAFDFSVWELWGALLHGGRLVVVPRRTARSPSSLRDLIVDQRVTILNATPSLFLTAMDDLLGAADALALRLVVFGGEALQPSGLRRWFERFGDETPRLVNMYGITETTVHVTYRPLRRTDCERDTSPIGEPIADLQAYVLDGTLEPVPEGVPGELFVGGAGVARGYLNRPQLTAERFLPNPFRAGTLYRTGDRARHVRGELLYLGRIDDQVKIRGFRIELGEIEAALRDHPTVHEALVVARDFDGDKRLVAYLVGDDPGLDARAHLRKSLPEYMIPSAFVRLDAFPLTPNGKIDRGALAALPLTEREAGRTLRSARTDTERRITAIWKQLLALDEIGVDQDFFELGGHSLLAVRLFAEIERRIGVRLPLSALFDTATIAGLAELVDRERREKTEWRSVVQLRPGAGPLPLFLVAWAGGEVIGYRDLVKNLEDGLPVYGLRAPGVDRRTKPLRSLQELASFYVDEVRRVQPHGPYNLGGFCFSGIIAYEMARLLQADGESIATLALIDTYPYFRRQRTRLIEVGRTQLDAFKRADAPGRREWVRKRIAGVRARVRDAVYFRVGPHLYEHMAERGLDGLLPHRLLNLVLVASNLAWERYVPASLDVEVDFFRAQRTPGARPTPWDGFATRGVNLHQIVAPDIDHEGLMRDPHAKTLAKQLMESMAGTAMSGTEHGRPVRTSDTAA